MRVAIEDLGLSAVKFDELLEIFKKYCALIYIKRICSELLFIIKSSEFLCSPGAAKAYSHVKSLFVCFVFAF